MLHSLHGLHRLPRLRNKLYPPVLVGAALGVVLVLSACGANLSGEPEIVSEREIRSTAPPVLPTAPPGETTATENAAQEPDRTLGRQLFVAVCAGCHSGQDGATGPALFGMGEVAAGRVPGLSAEEYLYQSIVDPGAYLVEGYPDIMPRDYADQFSEHELRSMVAFVLEAEAPPPLSEITSTQTLAPAAAAASTPAVAATVAPASTPAVAATVAPASTPAETVTVRAHLIQGTAGGAPISAGLPVELYALTHAGTTVGVYPAFSMEGGTVLFEHIPRQPGNIYFVRLDYAGVPQGAQIGPIQGDETELPVEVTLYERTTDRAQVAVSWAQMLINYAPINEFGLEVRLDVELVNTGDQIVTTDEVGSIGWPISVKIELPVGAFGIQPMQAEGTERYQVEVINEVPVVMDSWPLRPKQTHKITVLYYLPYRVDAVLDQAFGFPVMDATILLPNDTVTFESDQFDPVGEFRYRVAGGGLRVTELSPDETIDPDKDVTLIKAHDLLAPLGADERLIFTLAGRPTRTVNVMSPTFRPQTDSDINPLAYVLAGAGLAVIAMSVALWWRQRRAVIVPPGQAAPVSTPRDGWKLPPRSASKTDLLKALAALEAGYEAGQMDEETYLERRALLKERLLPLLDDEDKGRHA